MKEIRLQIAELKRTMREKGIRKVSCFNGGLSPDEMYYNGKLFELEILLRKG